tara:strand:- start:2472 stop:3578 length:1107 start_codon:yes stop_codon:yes gene_type:complete
MLIKNILILVVVTIISLKISDIVFNKFFNPVVQIFEDNGIQRSLILKEYNPNKKAILVPPSQILLNNKSMQKQYKLNIDHNGFIKNGNSLKKIDKNESASIIFFGSSTVESLYVSEEKRFISLVERNLSKKFERNIYLLNGGVSGNNSIHSLLNFIGKGVPLKPQYSVLMQNGTDLSLLRKSGSYWSAPNSRSIIQIDQTDQTTINLIRNLAKKIKNLIAPNIWGFFRAKINERNSTQDEFKSIRNQTAEFNNIKKMFRSALKSFVSVSRAWDVEPILMTEFSRINLKDKYFLSQYPYTDGIEYVEQYQEFNNIIREVARSENVLIIDLAKAVPQTDDFIYDGIHLNEKGSLLVADIITKFFEGILSN